MKRLLILPAAVGAIALSLGTAEANPEFKFGKADAVKDVKKTEWKASALAGLIITTGNAETTSLSGGAKASRKEGNNQLQLEASGVFVRSTLFIVNDLNNNGIVDSGEIDTSENTTSKAWLVRSRYDRFLTKMNSLYVTASVSGDEPAGKEFIAGAQAGYSRQIYSDKKHKVVGEAGYDFSYEDLTVGDAISIHSLRAFIGYEGKLTSQTGLSANLEVLDNLNTLEPANGTIDPFDDLRLNGGLALTTQLRKNISFRFAFTGKYDKAPAPRAPIAGLAYADGFVPLARRVDTKTEASLIINFL